MKLSVSALPSALAGIRPGGFVYLNLLFLLSIILSPVTPVTPVYGTYGE
jgi:hypothetical protein